MLKLPTLDKPVLPPKTVIKTEFIKKMCKTLKP
jgi:hypothetical protein